MDWIGATLGITGSIIIMRDVRLATIIWLVSNAAFIAWALYTGTYSILTLNLTYLTINTVTLVVRWRKP